MKTYLLLIALLVLVAFGLRWVLAAVKRVPIPEPETDAYVPFWDRISHIDEHATMHEREQS
ncbi:hypothetical protein [Pararobbsia silviterrae]|uniref:Uncharacterized protein n=1 Tax=Pararobbsia silviterrae TaxID=1792498 RepID=A0A494Y7V3_9BURK|nr:hypothetical protein [Pararobbsia silviterrae]RKP56396.1 hypothetical protein D7S86_08345 [Pararobbsia silviterrae]